MSSSDPTTASRGDDEQLLAEVVGRMSSAYPTVSNEQLAELVRDCLRLTADATVIHYRAVLAERRVRAQLRIGREARS